MEFSVDHNKYYRGYGKNRKNAHEKKVDMYPKKSKYVQRMRDRDNKHAMLDITNNYNLPQKMTRNCQNLKYIRYTHYKNIEDYLYEIYESFGELLEIQQELMFRREEEEMLSAYELEIAQERMYRRVEDKMSSYYEYSQDTSLRKRAYSDDNDRFSVDNGPEIKKHHNSSENITCPNCAYEF